MPVNATAFAPIKSALDAMLHANSQLRAPSSSAVDPKTVETLRTLLNENTTDFQQIRQAKLIVSDICDNARVGYYFDDMAGRDPGDLETDVYVAASKLLDTIKPEVFHPHKSILDALDAREASRAKRPWWQL